MKICLKTFRVIQFVDKQTNEWTLVKTLPPWLNEKKQWIS